MNPKTDLMFRSTTEAEGPAVEIRCVFDDI